METEQTTPDGPIIVKVEHPLEDILLLSKNRDGGINEAYGWALKHFMQAVRNSSVWKIPCTKTRLSLVVTALDEAWLLLALMNNWDRWMDMISTQITKTSEVEARFTMGLTPGSGDKELVSRKHGGWSRQAIDEFNSLVERVQKDRLDREVFEAHFMEKWKEEAGSGGKKSRRNRNRGEYREPISKAHNLLGDAILSCEETATPSESEEQSDDEPGNEF